MLWQSSFFKRVFSAVLGIPFILISVWYGGVSLMLLTALIMLLGLSEMISLMLGLGIKTKPFLVFFGGVILLLGAYINGVTYSINSLTILILIYFIFPLFYIEKISFINVSVMFFSTLYVGMITYLYLLRNVDGGLKWLILLLLCTWVNDTMAYLGGKKFGKVPLAPKVSPGKTREGAFFGVIGSVFVAFLLPLVYPSMTYLVVLPLGILIAVAGQFGDLVQSAIKREAGVKDTGNLIPGHGGILDRFDSMLFTAPTVYVYVCLFIIR